jgi:hypothetical protein
LTSDDGPANKFSFSTRIAIPQRVGDVIEVDGKKVTVDQDWINAKIDEMADAAVAKKEPDLPEDQFEASANKQSAFIKAEYKEWTVSREIAAEFEAQIADSDVQEAIKWYKKKKDKIQGNVQYEREPRKDNPDDKDALKRGETIPLDEPMVYHLIRVSKTDGSLWCKIYDSTQPKAGKRVLATTRDPETKAKVFLTSKTLESWLRKESVFAGIEKYQLCIHGKGANLHASMTEMLVRRGPKLEAGSKVDAEIEAAMDDFGGEFASDDDDDDEAPPAPTPANLTGIEKQLAVVKKAAAADDDDE